MKQVQSYKVEITINDITRHYTLRPYVYEDESAEGPCFEATSLDAFCEAQVAAKQYIRQIHCGETLFRKRRYLTLSGDPDTRFYDPKIIRARFYYEPVNWTYTLKDLFSSLSSDECLEYIRDQGLINCPLFQENT